MTGWFHANVDYSDVNRTIGDIRKYSGKTVLRIGEAVDKSVKAIAKKARQNAPRGKTGKLRKNLRTKRMDNNKYGPEGWAYVRGGRKGAPHGHLVELGARSVAVSARRKEAMHWDNFTSGECVVRTGPLRIPARKANPFLGPAYNDEKEPTIKRLQQAITPKKNISK